jgi:hypothetical protein
MWVSFYQSSRVSLTYGDRSNPDGFRFHARSIRPIARADAAPAPSSTARLGSSLSSAPASDLCDDLDDRFNGCLDVTLAFGLFVTAIQGDLATMAFFFGEMLAVLETLDDLAEEKKNQVAGFFASSFFDYGRWGFVHVGLRVDGEWSPMDSLAPGC